MSKSTIAIIAFTVGVILTTLCLSIYFDFQKDRHSLQTTKIEYNENQSISALVSNLDKLKDNTYLYISIRLSKNFNNHYKVSIDYGDKEYEREFDNLESMLAFLSDQEANFHYIINAQKF